MDEMKQPLIIHKYKYYSKKIILITILTNLATILACFLFVSSYYDNLECSPEADTSLFADGQTELKINNGKTVFDFGRKTFEYRAEGDDRILLRGSFANRIDLQNDYTKVKFDKVKHGHHLVRLYPNPRVPQIELVVKTKHLRDNITCNSFEWTQKGYSPVQDIEDCFSIEDAFWFGQSEARTQYWPINNVSNGQEYRPYLTGLFDSYSSVIERYWMSTSGVAIIVDQAVPLFVLKNTTTVCLLASDQKPYSKRKVFLNYNVCHIDAKKSPRDYMNKLHLFVIDTYFKKPTGLPDLRMLKSPVWSTWAVYKKDINTDLVRKYARNIVLNNYTNSQLEIDDKWQVFYGNFEFDEEKFSNIKALVSELNDMGFRTTLWVFPFINYDSNTFFEVTTKGYAITVPGSTMVSLTGWWDGPLAALLDFTNPNTTDWYVGHLNKIRKETGIDSFKFDAGEFNFVPHQYSLKNAPTTPEEFSMGYARTAARLGTQIEIRVGTLTQDLPVFRRMIDKDSVWGLDNGLSAVLTSTLAMSFLGYSFVLPDMIGGNAYAGQFPDYQLFVRWTQLNAFLPSMQFSIPPWSYDYTTEIKVNQICRDYVNLHENLVYPLLIKYGKMAIETGEPITRPVWWIDNSDENTYEIYDEFLIGNELLVAPILNKDQYQRDVYLPSGNWKFTNGTVFTGPTVLKKIPAPIYNIPFFTAV